MHLAKLRAVLSAWNMPVWLIAADFEEQLQLMLCWVSMLYCPEREVLEACVRQLNCPSLPAGVRDLLAPLVTLYAAAAVEKDLSWFLTQEIVPAKVRKVAVVAVTGKAWML